MKYSTLFRTAHTCLIVHRIPNVGIKNTDLFAIQIDDCKVDDDLLTKKQLLKFLVYPTLRGGMQLDLEEVAFMREAFKEDPTAIQAHFGIHGTFMFVK